MPQKQSSFPNGILSHQLARPDAREAHWERRLEAIAAKYYQAQADFHCLRAEFQATLQECQRLRSVVQAKQQLIELLLPYYPHSLTPESQALLALT